VLNYQNNTTSLRIAWVVVANPAQVKLIAASLVKTDKRDTLALARRLSATLIPAVWVPPRGASASCARW
jgi:transposase